MDSILTRVDTRTVASTAVFTAFVAAATAVFSVYIPATTGYFNVGEVMVYTSALLMGPYVGAFAGGAGSMLSDLSLGYPYYAPGTLLIKGFEGFLVGYLSRRTLSTVSKTKWKGVTLIAGLTFASTLSYIGTRFLSGEFSLSLGGAWNIPASTTSFTVPWFFWVALASVSFVVILFFGLRAEARTGLAVLSVLVGGLEMVSGYYLYESFIIGLIAPASVVAAIAPAAEVPFNAAQVLIGLLVSVPLTKSINRMIPSLASARVTPLRQIGDQKDP